MAEKEKIFSSKVKYDGIFDFKEFYKFCYEWLTDELGFEIMENKYAEKISGNTKDVEVEWEGKRKLTDYFRFDIKVNFRILRLAKIEINKDGRKVDTNSGSVEVKMAGTLVRDYQGKFEISAGKKFMRSIYEKWVIPNRIEQFEGKVVGDCDEFLSQAKAFLDLEGKR